ncbi:formate dehydrogenase-specific chaperone [Campylobacter sp. RM9344]|uniref:Formate dehydrogenase-specific chaperone n=1 Tax=Campylobacter californiensis TaxID=1032243 RepID=A0AAW3ZXP5_9BACT|nr:MULTISPECIES: formate dehydrogenase-specific chaperone [unclassified Campylobacter]MBE2984090.1 formate dehydrogenase-specific chaperone [Campylobacter sp. RM6883]MBE2986284.1 formate dehydrogenase-specific chaperone [Campylobacter sp. RM12919]MBE2988408.1 formate dehydrogenase-specific chaperone [Campylobacter sp. RM12920]MBE2995752.1 formate dehydrogenase-specific chaperone [Campylobacter sp. RM6913]MBE3029859.1 formate dehydrogenase-specific chaperone [Campylobacter sp. RM9344]
MNKNIDILKARSYYYEFFAMPFFFYENDKKFKIWQEQLNELAKNPLSKECEDAFNELKKISFDEFKDEQNSVLFDLSYVNVPLSVSFYEEGRDEGAARLRVIEILKKSEYRRDLLRCPDSEDFVGFVFFLMMTFLRDEADSSNKESFADELFVRVINGFVDEFTQMILEHEKAKFFKFFAVILETFMALERSMQGVEAPVIDQSVQTPAQAALGRKPYKTKMPTVKSKIHWEEFSTI